MVVCRKRSSESVGFGEGWSRVRLGVRRAMPYALTIYAASNNPILSVCDLGPPVPQYKYHSPDPSSCLTTELHLGRHTARNINRLPTLV
jgi:hypothetical protein